MAKVILSVVDFLELDISFESLEAKTHFLFDVDKLNKLGLKEKTEFLGEDCTKLPHRRNHKSRFELVSKKGIYFDISSSPDVGKGYLLKILLLKPLDRALPCLLFEKPIETMEEVLGKLRDKYGNKSINYSIAQVHLACHFTGIKFKASDSKRFFGLPRGPWEHDKGFTGFSFKHKRAKIKRVEASLYHIGSRLEDIPNSFNPKMYYPGSVNLSQVYNIEFKIFKKFLSERSLNDLSSLRLGLASLWKILTTEKVRMIVKSKDTNKGRWKTNRHWKTIQNAFGTKWKELKRVKAISQRETPEQMIKKIQTQLTGLSASLDLWDIPLEERVKHIYGCFDIKCFSDSEMIKYRYERNLW